MMILDIDYPNFPLCRASVILLYYVAFSHNWPQITTFRIIRQKSHNSDKILLQILRKEQGNISLLLKFFDNWSVVSRWFTSQKTLEIIKIVREGSIDQTSVLWVVLHTGDLLLVLNIGKEETYGHTFINSLSTM